MFEDADSLVVVLVQRSLAVGQPQDWAMSPVLFLPEIGLYLALSLLGLTTRETLVLNAVVNLVALYAAIRLVAGSRKNHGRPVLTALAAFTTFCGLALLDGGPGRSGFQLASLVTTTTYYAATVIAGVVAIGLVRRAFDRPARVRRHAWPLGAVVTVSTLSNPLFAAWVTVPALVALGIVVLLKAGAARTTTALAAALLTGTALGYLARTPLARFVVADPDNYLRPNRWAASLEYYAGQLATTPRSLTGALSLEITVACFVVCAAVALVALHRGLTGAAVVGLVGVVSPLATLVGAAAMGTEADRYLQPWVFLPVLAIVVADDFLWPPPWQRDIRFGTVTAGLFLMGTAALALPPTVRAATSSDPDLQCVVNWIDNSRAVGAGQFWSVRAAKAYVADPRSLVQVDYQLHPYDWLVNREDHTGTVSFLLQDAHTQNFELPHSISAGHIRHLECGRYTILDLPPSSVSRGR